VIDQVRDPDAHVQTVVCWGTYDDKHPLLVVPAPIVLPTLHDRSSELIKIVNEYAVEAVAALGAPIECLSTADRAWVIKHGTASLDEIEKSVMRLVAIRGSCNLSAAAARLGMAPVSLSRWISRRGRLPAR
jgi:hypothetical protein